jgi:hypothetical protein
MNLPVEQMEFLNKKVLKKINKLQKKVRIKILFIERLEKESNKQWEKISKITSEIKEEMDYLFSK